MVLDKPLDSLSGDGTFAPGLPGGPLQHSVVGDGSFRSGLKPWQKLKPSIEILCNNQAKFLTSFIFIAFSTIDLLSLVFISQNRKLGSTCEFRNYYR